MKVNDIVVLKNGLNSFYLVLEMEKHLFKIVKIDGDMARLKSLSTGVEVAVELESIRLATLKEKYLVDGNVVELENGVLYLVVNGGIIGKNSHDILEVYDNNMFHKNYKEFDIIKVYKHINPSHDYSYNSFERLLDNDNNKLLWERSIELTDDEKVILRNVDKDYNYIMRTENNLLVSKSMFFSKYPDTMTMSAYNHLFKNITTESGIHEIKELLK